MDTDQRYLQADAGTSRDDGCTAVTAVLHRKRLVVANVGDSRAVLSRNGQGELLGCEAQGVIWAQAQSGSHALLWTTHQWTECCHKGTVIDRLCCSRTADQAASCCATDNTVHHVGKLCRDFFAVGFLYCEAGCCRSCTSG